MGEPILVWIRKDLRLVDNPALFHALKDGIAVPVYIYDEDYEREWSLGGASKWWLHQALSDFESSIHKLGGKLIIRYGDTWSQLHELIHEIKPKAIYWNRRYEPHIVEKDQQIERMTSSKKLDVKTFNAHLLHEPWEIAQKNGNPYKVFTAYYKATQKQLVSNPVPKITQFSKIERDVYTESVSDLKLLPTINWTHTIEKTWNATENGGISLFKQFLKQKMMSYESGRDFPAKSIHSSLSPYFAFGQLSPRVLYHYLLKKAQTMHSASFQRQSEQFLRQLVWRDFAYHLLYHFPDTTVSSLNPLFTNFKWEKHEKHFNAWKKGQTGYPLVDAGMRQLWQTGFMHNRVRMVTSSFLVKHLLIHWKEGAQWFWDTLVDADLANNTLGWQWIAGSGADAAPYFRIFNPITQSEKFDHDAEYIKMWVPELRNLPNTYIHKPWETPQNVLNEAGIQLGETYPFPIVEHKAARARALERYHELKASQKT
ncbi:cryptochrome/photolyase family protein [Metabacillus iocasae]|uniref:Deoxyribodipyrimidine photo-lyase n=1 Tax=Priestia iocasae TaxID=2291674 RepID=A0ABS2QSN9_9BACI|nr:deoxyribodipyrimidine photo-lyase [Metabacillus iocasae]MBM7701982.1 deoxyribodipyrimidine photo-lyase [Metabacillus iocasae]